MRLPDYDFLIDGKPVLLPDGDVEMEITDIEAEDSGRDESGVMHRKCVRQGIRSWKLVYGVLTAEEYRYMEGLFAGKVDFTLTFRGPDGKVARCDAFRGDHGITIHNTRLGVYRNYKFSITEC